MTEPFIKIKDLRNNQINNKQESLDKSGDDVNFWSFLKRDISLSGNKLPDKIKEAFYLELGVLLEAGVDIRTSLDLLIEEQAKKKYKQVLKVIRESVVAGSTLSAAMHQSDSFTSYEYFSVQIGEETGGLIEILKDMAVYFQKRIQQKRQIIGAMTYPVVILLVAFGAVSFMMAYVVPMFADILKRFGSDLPLITKMVVALSAWIRRSIVFFLVIILIMTGFCITQRKKDWFRDKASRFMLKLPVIGSIILKINLSRFANTMSLLIKSKIPILTSIHLVHKMINFYPIEKSLYDMERNIISGMPLHKSMAAHTIYPSKMILLLKVGEEVNKLDIFFQKIAEQYNRDVEHQTNILSKLLEPVIIIVLGVVVGIILIAMYLPLFKMGQAF